MESDYLPKTKIELENWMKENCFHFDTYSINGNSIYEGWGIEHTDGQFIWYFTERGLQKNLESFKSEAEIVEYAFNEIKSDQTARTHIIGFSADRNKIINLKNELDQMNIEFIQDTIAYYGLKEPPVYRVFVVGCDIRKTEHLKEKYCTD
jgi:hypothetical protein